MNLSPKGLDTFRMLGPRSVAYLDLTGSGIETAAHLQENGRIVLMFCAFDASPKILRFHGRGRYSPQGDYAGERDTLERWAEKKGPDGIEEYKRTKNAASIDGLPGLREEAPAPGE